MAVFWCFAAVLSTVRICIAAFRVRSVLGTASTANDSRVVYYCHVLFFALIASLEIAASCTLLAKYRSASRVSSRERMLSSTLYPYLMKSTIIRLGMLALVGISRTITFYFLVPTRTPDSSARTADSCAYTIECAFPAIL